MALEHLKRNDTATAGCKLYLTKPLGVGVLTTALKQGKLLPEHMDIAPESMTRLNSIGADLGPIKGIKAMTDVTGFGLLGHLSEMCQGSGLSAVIEFDKIPRFEMVDQYIAQNCLPGGTHRNWDSYGHLVKLKNENYKALLCDPQTSGGLLIAVDDSGEKEVLELLKSHGVDPQPIGSLKEKGDIMIQVI